MITRGYTWYVCQTHPRSTKYYDMCLDLSQNSKYITVASHVPFEPPDNFSLFEPTEDSFFLHHILDLPPSPPVLNQLLVEPVHPLRH